MDSNFDIISPVDGRLYATRTYARPSEISAILSRAKQARLEWRRLSFDEREKLVFAFLNAVEARAEPLALQVAWQMGRPLWKADETKRLKEWSELTAKAARKFLQPLDLVQDETVRREIDLDPLGICLSISAWNYPVVMAASLVSAPLLLGNVVIYKPSPQTALVGDVFNEAATAAGLPAGVFQSLNMTHTDAESMIGSGDIDLVQFVGSTRGGQAVYDAGRGTFTRFGLELGGKDPAYFRSDAQIESIMDDVIEGCFGNAGQSCCSVERIYVHRSIYDRFLEALVAEASKVGVGHPIEERPMFGPLVSTAAARRVKSLTEQAVRAGAKPLLPVGRSPLPAADNAYVEHQFLTNADHSMDIYRDEVFGPVVPIIAVDSDEQAVGLMNDSDYGLTASIWSQDIDTALALGRRVESGTFYVNQGDFADRILPWGGVKKSGIGRSYGIKGLEELVQARSYHIRTRLD
ncbi:aldehyde dehydrogenase family protein [Mesorhizobium sp. 2RAF21]|uniref:aldehyde dehydrogenase family protein n=1 Tax=Mesorhizobium sp. 2RAF21 TaxID=3232995 RepID=UPI003F9742A1